MPQEFPPNNPNHEFEIGQKVSLKNESKSVLAHINLGINPDNVLTVLEYHVNIADENGDTVILRDESGAVSGHIAVWHLNKVLN